VQLPWDEHFHEIVIPAWQAYLAAETRLTDAINAKNENASTRAGYDALREGGAATIYLHHFAEVVMRASPDWVPGELTSGGVASLGERSLHDVADGSRSGGCPTLRGCHGCSEARDPDEEP